MQALHRWLTVPLLRLLNRLAADTAARVGGGVGVLAWNLGIRRRLAAQQLTASLGIRGPARARILRRAYATMGANFLEVWTIGGPCGPERDVSLLAPRWTAQVFARHPAAVFITTHQGPWDMAAHAVARVTGRVSVYAKAQHNPEVDALLNAQRARAGLEVVLVRPGERGGAVLALRALRRGQPLGLMADQRPGRGEGLPAFILGRAAWCHDGPAFFAHRAGVPIIPGVALRRRAGRSVLFIGRPMAPGADRSAQTQAGMDLISALIAAAPGQYFWHHRRWAGPQPELPARAAEPWRVLGAAYLIRHGAQPS